MEIGGIYFFESTKLTQFGVITINIACKCVAVEDGVCTVQFVNQNTGEIETRAIRSDELFYSPF